MHIVDLTHVIAPDMPVYPGTELPQLLPASTYEKDGFRETLLHMFSHTGTHMDAPAHLLDGHITLDAMDAAAFCGSAVVVDCTHLQSGDRITMDLVERVRPAADAADFLLFHTGWDRFWGKPEYFGDYPFMTMDVADYIIHTHKKGVGLDVIGIDPIPDANLTIHRRLFGAADLVIIENLCHLDRLGSGVVQFAALPMKYTNADGAPVRAIAAVEELR